MSEWAASSHDVETAYLYHWYGARPKYAKYKRAKHEFLQYRRSERAAGIYALLGEDLPEELDADAQKAMRNWLATKYREAKLRCPECRMVDAHKMDCTTSHYDKTVTL